MARSVRLPLQLKVRMLDILAGSLLSRTFLRSAPLYLRGHDLRKRSEGPSGIRTVHGPVPQYFNTVNQAI